MRNRKQARNGRDGSAWGGSPARMAATAVVVLTAAVAACSSSPAELETQTSLEVSETAGVVLMTQDVVHDVTMDALYEGVVAADDAGCLRLGGDGATVVWPRGYTAQGSLGEVWIRDDEARVVGQVGGSFSLPGGEVAVLTHEMGFTLEDREAATSACPGTYWIVG